ncbi:hypothetical protein CORC01_05036 [Colletotrichum orchidophilum]|uniref:TLC domain-containing protein n=1 Tax=Colletotrichum orchidophilum TaxID=1209926 RepID=A0A1G4BE87_9PEZI|nr:uncharacterized protein CORC01_05036 [Colletotrichum orchidophilum]OHE99678.1 hypothetical protein CORC01_05036 [Colletotrichum orchidophilum]
MLHTAKWISTRTEHPITYGSAKLTALSRQDPIELATLRSAQRLPLPASGFPELPEGAWQYHIGNRQASQVAPYFVFPLGFLVTLVTTPICIAAYNDTSSATDTFGLDRPFTANGKICLASRAALWTSELPLLSYSPEYVAHHVLSLSSLGLFLIGRGPRRPLYVIYAGLVTELFFDTAALMRFHGRAVTNSPMLRKVVVANVVSMVLLRLLPIMVHSAAMPQTRADYLGGIASYCIHICRLSFVQLRCLGCTNAKAGRQSNLALADAADDKYQQPKSVTSLIRRPMALVVGAAVVVTALTLKELDSVKSLPWTASV